MALALYNSGDAAEAIIYQQKAVLINERVQGLDHHETAQSYGNLGLFCRKMGKSKLALNYVQRALFLGLISSGIHHPDNSSAFLNIGLIYQDLDEIETSLTYFATALATVPSIPPTPQGHPYQKQSHKTEKLQQEESEHLLLLPAAM